MPRGKKIIIETEVDDEFVNKFRSIDLEEIRSDRKRTEKGLSSSVANVFKVAQNLYRQKAGEEELETKHELYSVRGAYDYLKDSGVFISFRAFGGRIERGTVPFVKVGRKRFIPKSILQDIVDTKGEFYTVKEAFEEYKKANNRINFRAFIGRIEKGSIPSVKFGTRRLVPKDAVEALTHISNNYYSVSQAIKELNKSGIKIKRNAFERRLDRGRIPHEKVGGRRFIHEDVLRELVDKEQSFKRS
ncbi:hypothetical protein KKF81_04335 [Candidatus Micrarchaeota archaeon]|nr:hypothetical protein [Candidatus Micrarchaeota archaeon]MBU1166154.1 hypothetical protein [Candidatus Micrarchaeota archaeon]MBU1887302.1 hypothetical protein [Candidatus Micrarchaeota archaeon]